ncbi:MAG: hypothetical protein CMH52_02620 [Myxococcales bacterium]|nr:hypothetical protein [Myxococcales bacterium]
MDSMQNTIHYMGGVNLDLDLTFAIQLAFVLTLMVVLNKFVFGPYLKAVDERGRRTATTKDEAAKLRAEADALAGRYESSLADARRAALEAKLALRTEGIDQKDSLIQSARSDANTTIDKAQKEIDDQLTAERPNVDTQVAELSTLVVQKVIGRAV